MTIISVVTTARKTPTTTPAKHKLPQLGLQQNENYYLSTQIQITGG